MYLFAYSCVTLLCSLLGVQLSYRYVPSLFISLHNVLYLQFTFSCVCQLGALWVQFHKAVSFQVT